jgi:hypothetical protein
VKSEILKIPEFADRSFKHPDFTIRVMSNRPVRFPDGPGIVQSVTAMSPAGAERVTILRGK